MRSVQQSLAAIYLSNLMHLHSTHLSFRCDLSKDLEAVEKLCMSISAVTRVTTNKTTFTPSSVLPPGRQAAKRADL